MKELQKTLKKSVTLEGIGLHSGENVRVILEPAEPNNGYIFKRVDLENQPEIKAIIDNVVATSRGTTVKSNEASVATIEHLLAALYGLGLDNVNILVNGPEIPILDGSAKKYIESIQKAGIQEQDAEKDYVIIDEQISYKDNEQGIELMAFPDEYLNINVQIDYNSKVLGKQYATFSSETDFVNEIAPCRTFVFFHELEYLREHNLIKGGDLENAIVIMEKSVEQDDLDRMADLFNKPRVKIKPNGILNNVDLFFTNEPARHKLLDVLGDLALIGRPIKGKILVTKPGHHVNTEFAKKILDTIRKEKSKDGPPKIDLSEPPLYNINNIKEILPHRPPFLLIDKILRMNDSSIVGLKNVTMNEGFFIGHFPEEPIMPGVLQVEAMAQVGGILALNTVPDPENYSTYLLKIDKVRLKKKVVPGDTIIFKLDLTTPIRRGLVNMTGKAFVGNNIVLEGEMMAQIVKIKSQNTES